MDGGKTHLLPSLKLNGNKAIFVCYPQNTKKKKKWKTCNTEQRTSG